MTQAALPLRPDRDVSNAVLVHVLSTHHTGRANGIGAAALALKLGISERALRLCISTAREEGIAIVGTPETGYFIAQTADELEECCQFLRARAMHSLLIESRLRKVALPELLGQLRVGT
jgi:biotin operon repressor